MENKTEAEVLLLKAIESQHEIANDAEKRLSELREQALEQTLKKEKAERSIKSLNYALQSVEKSLMFYKDCNNAD